MTLLPLIAMGRGVGAAVAGQVRRASWRAALVGAALLSLSGCLAQKADLRNVQDDLEKKIASLVKQEKDLQQSIKQARHDLDGLITDTRARMRAEVATIREQDLPKVQGKQEEQEHTLSTFRAQVDDLSVSLRKRLETIEKVQLSHAEALKAERERAEEAGRLSGELKKLSDAMVVLGQTVDKRLEEQDKSIQTGQAKVAESLTHRMEGESQELTKRFKEFQGAFAEFKGVLGEVDGRLAKSEARLQEGDQRSKELSAAVTGLTKRADGLAAKLEADERATSQHLGEVNKSITSVAKTVESVGDKLLARIQEQDVRLEEIGRSLAAVRGKGAARATDNQSARPKSNASGLNGRPAGKSQRASMPSSAEAGSEGPKEPETQSSNGARAEVPQQVASVDPAPRSVETKGPVGKTVYDENLQKFKGGDFEGARQGFADFLTLYPSSELAPNAHYWIGESYFGAKDYPHAIDSFARMRATYPKSDKVPAALLMEGYAYLALKDQPKAASLLRQVVLSYPKTPEAGKASTKLSQFKSSR